MSRFPDCPTKRLLAFREQYFENCLKTGRIGLEAYSKLQKLAEEASKDNPIAIHLPDFSISLLDEDGAFGLVEYCAETELPKI